MSACLRDELAGSLSRREYVPLKRVLSGRDAASLAGIWMDFPPMERLLLFKLLPPPRALELFNRLGFEERYRLFCGFDKGAAAPALENLPEDQAAAFEEIPEDAYRRMLDGLLESRP